MSQDDIANVDRIAEASSNKKEVNLKKIKDNRRKAVDVRKSARKAARKLYQKEYNKECVKKI